MKDPISDANFPRTADGRMYHLGFRPGELANRIVTVGPPSRAHGIAMFLAEPRTQVVSERGFITITGVYAGTRVSVVAIGMGAPNMDMFVREARECVRGDMVIIRLGSCGALEGPAVGDVVLPRASVGVVREYDFDYADRRPRGLPYHVTKPVDADPQLHGEILRALESARLETQIPSRVHGDVVNASGDSFYSSQGRQTSFPDHNACLLAHLTHAVPGLASLEMETFHLFHLAASFSPPDTDTDTDTDTETPVPRIRAAAAQIVFAKRTSGEFIAPELVSDVETWAGCAVLDALVRFEVVGEVSDV